MTKRLIAIDDDALAVARAELGTVTMKDTVNEALRQVKVRRKRRVAKAVSVLAELGERGDLIDREDMWR